MFGSPETTTGGNALKFYASVRLDIRRIGQIKDKETVVGNQTRVKVVKNKMAPPFRVIDFDIMYGEGISKTGELLDLGVAANVVEKSGSWFSYAGTRIGQGRENAKQFLKDNRRIRQEPARVRRRQLKGGPAPSPGCRAVFCAISLYAIIARRFMRFGFTVAHGFIRLSSFQTPTIARRSAPAAFKPAG
jgi:hypothetical protein